MLVQLTQTLKPRILRQFRVPTFHHRNIFSPLVSRISSVTTSNMKRQAKSDAISPKAKRRRAEVPEYHATPTMKDDDGVDIWPAPKEDMERARAFILECAAARSKTLIVPDKDADGLSSGAILYRTLLALGLPASQIEVHLVQKGNSISDEVERDLMTAKEPEYVFVLDQGSRSGPPVVDRPHRALVIDHHYAAEKDFPHESVHITACNSPPVATSSLLTYELCSTLHNSVSETCDWLCVIGTHGDLGNTLKWEHPFPNMKDTFKRHTKKTLNDAVSLLNAPRRTAEFDVISAWNALLAAEESPVSILRNRRLLEARAAVNAEVEKCTHTAPKFSADARIAVFRISSAYQVHPVIATRWAGHLQSSRLEVVMVANEGYLPDKVNFSCRIPRCARANDPPVNIIQVLRSLADSSSSGDLTARLGESFARGHKEASGGIVGREEFEELMSCLRIGGKMEEGDGNGTSSSPAKKKAGVVSQKNTLMKYFGKPAAAEVK